MRAALPLLALAACAPQGASFELTPLEAVEEPAAAARRNLVLTVDGLNVGESPTLTATGGNPGDRVRFLVGTAGSGPCPAFLGGQCLGITGPSIAGSALTQASGVASRTVALPASAAPGDVLTFQAVITAGASSVLSTPVTVTVGTYEAQAFERAKVDVLFVVDDSCSMYDEQQDLVTSFPFILNRIASSDFDYHVGVVSTDMDNPARSGKLVSASGYLFVDEDTPYPETVFATMASLGTSGSGTEKGLLAMTASLDAWGATLNAGFHRADAQLAVVVMSDEDDFSPQLPPFYSDWLATLKSSPDDARLHSLVTTSGSFPSQRYLDVSAATGGAAQDIATLPWLGFFNDVADSLTTSQPLLLSGVPDPTTLEVVVAEATGDVTLVQGTDYVYDAADNSVRFTGYVTAAGTPVDIRYLP